MFSLFIAWTHCWTNIKIAGDLICHDPYVWHRCNAWCGWLVKRFWKVGFSEKYCQKITDFCVNTLRPRQNGRHFADDIFKCIFLNENVWIPIKISMKFVPKGPINNIPALVQIMARRRPGDKPLSEPMMVCLLAHICVTRPQWVNANPVDEWTSSKLFSTWKDSN